MPVNRASPRNHAHAADRKNGPGKSVDTGKTSTIRVATANVRSNPLMAQSKVLHDVRAVARTADVIGWQEMEPARYMAAIRGLDKNKWGTFAPKDGKNEVAIPISYRKDKFEFLGGGLKRTHDGEAKVTPHRYISWANLRDKKSGEEIVQINTHAISGAWTPGKLGRPSTGFRQKMWKEHMSDLKQLVDRFEKAGKKVIISGDFNRDSFKLLGNAVDYDNKLNVGTHGKSTYDYLMHTRDPELKNVGVKYQRNLRTDHDSVIGTYELK